MRSTALLTAAVLTSAGVMRLWAQDSAAAAAALPAEVMAQFYGPAQTEISLGGQRVLAAPYSAEAVSTSTQLLIDGNRIERTTVSKRYRDKQGRTRHEDFPANSNVYTGVTIEDPVAGAVYNLYPNGGTAIINADRATQSAVLIAGMRERKPVANDRVVASNSKQRWFNTPGPSVHAASAVNAPPPPRIEDLGVQTVEGVLAHGTRVTITTAAGAVGNERDILTVTERWYSSELKTFLLSKISDPRNGESVYRLKNIHRAEPDPALFRVPAEYTIMDQRSPASDVR